MKKVICVVVMFLMFGSLAHASELKVGDELKKIPSLTTGGYYSLIDSVFNYSATFKVLQTKNEMFALNLGYAGRAKESGDKAIVTVSANLLKLKDFTVPYLDLIIIEPYICAGFGSINSQAIGNSEFDLGVGVNVLKIAW